MNQKDSANLWNLNFFLLWQGKLVSMVGDVAYEIALGFWILAVTGSTALMGTLMAATLLPRVIIAPFAGVWVDRSDRKWLIVVTDLIRGIFIVLVGVAAITGIIQIWMVFVAGIMLGICGAFFGPAITSSIPDVVPKSRIVKANSAFSLVTTGANVVGSSAGGFLYQILGAPLLFLLNGISYILSAASELFVKIRRVSHKNAQFHFSDDLKSGLAFVWNHRGIKYIMFIASVLNFFASMGIMLVLPLFQRTEHLGAGLYGLLIGSFSGGAFLGFMLTSLVNIKSSHRFSVFYWCGIVFSIATIFIPIYLFFPVMLALAIVAGITNAILNALFSSILQLTVPQDKRGKVFGLLETLSAGLMPAAFAIGGILAEFVSVRILISSSFTITLLCFIPMAFMPDIVRLVNFDVEGKTQEVES
jgi:DHA3 family macrolide efflux protein-like MFS transporter